MNKFAKKERRSILKEAEGGDEDLEQSSTERDVL